MISHIDNQIEHADKVYYLNDGVISEETPNLTAP
jgi:ABC-type siderophore export system fused ATPase/permease subunit